MNRSDCVILAPFSAPTDLKCVRSEAARCRTFLWDAENMHKSQSFFFLALVWKNTRTRPCFWMLSGRSATVLITECVCSLKASSQAQAALGAKWNMWLVLKFVFVFMWKQGFVLSSSNYWQRREEGFQSVSALFGDIIVVQPNQSWLWSLLAAKFHCLNSRGGRVRTDSFKINTSCLEEFKNFSNSRQ